MPITYSTPNETVQVNISGEEAACIQSERALYANEDIFARDLAGILARYRQNAEARQNEERLEKMKALAPEDLAAVDALLAEKSQAVK